MSEREPTGPEVAAEVSGTPEQVWELIATGPGISTWFMPATVEPHVGGSITQRHGAGDDDVSEGTITAYEPPHRFVYEEAFEGQTVATEFLVEAKSGGSCVIRIVTHGLTGDDADFVDSLTSGWTQALAILRIRLAGFDGRPTGSARVWTHPEGELDEAWSASMRRAGLDTVRAGDPVERASDGPTGFRGEAELVQDHGVVIRVDAPQPGALSFIATGFGDRTSVVVDRYVYGDDAEAAAKREAAAWAEELTGA
jgi:uncharacterized protein YndB with AHSA1/START domain